jgi:hypothetical protein
VPVRGTPDVHRTYAGGIRLGTTGGVTFEFVYFGAAGALRLALLAKRREVSDDRLSSRSNMSTYFYGSEPARARFARARELATDS